MGRMGNLWSEFKAFAFKGNMLELAVAVVIGGAFGKVVNAMVDDIVMPAVSYAVTGVTAAKDAAVEGAKTVGEKTGIATSQPTTLPGADGVAAPVVAVTPPPPPPPPAPAPAPAADPTKAVQFDLMIGRFKVGDFVGALLNFIIIAFAVFIMIVKLVGSMMKKVAGSTPAPSEPTTKECPYCLSAIPIKAKKCAFCTSDQVATA